MNPTKSPPRQFAVALAALLVVSTQTFALDPNDVIAESARARLTLADYEAEIAKLPAGSRAEFAASELRLKQYLDNLYIARALAADARAEGLDKDPVLARQIATAVDKLLAQAQVDRIEAAAAAEFDKSADKYAKRVRELYDVNRAKYAVPEQVRAAHILLAVKAGKSDEAKRKAEEVHAKAVAGADFAQLARQFSDDPSVSKNGGELGFFDAKAMDPAFAAAAFAMTRKGEIEVRLPHHSFRGPPAGPRSHVRRGQAGTDGGPEDQGRRRRARRSHAQDFLGPHAQGERRAHRPHPQRVRRAVGHVSGAGQAVDHGENKEPGHLREKRWLRRIAGTPEAVRFHSGPRG